MNRKKVLFLYEMRGMVWFFAVALLAVAYILMNLYSVLDVQVQEVSQMSAYSYSMVGTVERGCVFAGLLVPMLKGIVCCCFAGFLFMSLVQFGDLQSRKRREYLNSLPFSQREKFLMKIAVSYGLITVCWLLFSLGVIAIRLKFQPQIIKHNVTVVNFRQIMGADTMWHTVRSLLLLWLTLLAMYSVLMVIQYMVRNSIVATLVGAGALVYPSGILAVCMRFCDNHFIAKSGMIHYVSQGGVTQNSVQNVFERMMRYAHTFTGDTMGSVYSSGDAFGGIASYFPKGWKEGLAVSYGQMWISFAIVIFLLAACTCLAWWVCEHQDLARINKLVPTKIGRIGLGTAIAVAVGGVIAGLFFQLVLAASIAVCVVVAAVIFVICQKIFRRI